MAEDASGVVLAAAREVFDDAPDASLERVARVAGVSRNTVYRLFGSRRGLLQALEVEPGPDARARVLAAALELVGRDGLARLSMDETAARAGVSRASLYRLFPGKAALFQELLRAYAPLETITRMVARLRERPPEEVMPAIARTVAGEMADRLGVVRTLLFEVSNESPDAIEAAGYVLSSGVAPLASYLLEQMAAGRLRRAHPLLAVQSFAGSIVFHLITRSVAERHLGLALPLEEAASQLAEQWVRGMRPDEGG